MKATSESFTAKESQADILARACEKTRIEAQDERVFRTAGFPKIVRTLMEILTDADLEKVAKVYLEALGAQQRHWVDEGKDPETGRARGHWEIIPDHKTRLAAANMIAAYKEGLPIQRQILMSKKFESAADIIERVKQSPEMLKAIMSLNAQGIQVEANGQVIDIELDVQKTGSESERDSSEKAEA